MAERKSILIVDDDDDLALALSIQLRAQGYSVGRAADSITALMVARREQPDLIILDLGLPGGDGLTFLQRLQSVSPVSLPPVIVLTAQDVSAEEAAMKAGAYAFFQKPADNDELLASVRSAL